MLELERVAAALRETVELGDASGVDVIAGDSVESLLGLAAWDCRGDCDAVGESSPLGDALRDAAIEKEAIEAEEERDGIADSDTRDVCVERTEMDANDVMRGSDVTVRESSEVADEELVGDIVTTADRVDVGYAEAVNDALGAALFDCANDPRVLRVASIESEADAETAEDVEAAPDHVSRSVIETVGDGLDVTVDETVTVAITERDLESNELIEGREDVVSPSVANDDDVGRGVDEAEPLRKAVLLARCDAIDDADGAVALAVIVASPVIVGAVD